VGIPIHAFVLDEDHLTTPAAQFERADDAVVHQRADVAVLEGVHCYCGVEEPLLLFA
jgi:hypothetical protein